MDGLLFLQVFGSSLRELGPELLSCNECFFLCGSRLNSFWYRNEPKCKILYLLIRKFFEVTSEPLNGTGDLSETHPHGRYRTDRLPPFCPLPLLFAHLYLVAVNSGVWNMHSRLNVKCSFVLWWENSRYLFVTSTSPSMYLGRYLHLKLETTQWRSNQNFSQTSSSQSHVDCHILSFIPIFNAQICTILSGFILSRNETTFWAFVLRNKYSKSTRVYFWSIPSSGSILSFSCNHFALS